MTETVRTRIAPSPTGDPHVGTAYVAMFNYALAKRHGGSFVLRIEDTDRARSTKASEDMILDALRWLGLEWDEGPDVGGSFGPYRQSERSEIYREHVEKLVASGDAYPCFCTRDRLDELRAHQRENKLALGYDGHCRSIAAEDAAKRRAAGESHVIRLAMPTQGEAVVTDLLRGEIRIDNAQVDDQVLVKSDGFPTYHLANVVDDHLMEITHVIRAEEWISSLPKHVRLYDAFGWKKPVFCHLPLLRNSDKSKISKRKNPVSLNHYRRAGFLPEALLNYLALMGWAMPDDREEFSLAEFADEITLERISLGGPVFDVEKLTWLNGKYIRGLDVPELTSRISKEFLSEKYLEQVVALAHERIETLQDFFAYAGFFFSGDVEYDEKALNRLVAKGRTGPQTAKLLRQLMEEALDPLTEWNVETVEAALRTFCETKEVGPKEIFMPVRIAVTGRAATPPLFDTMAVLGKEVCRSRMRRAIGVLRSIK